MIGIGECITGNLPSNIPSQVVGIQQQAHQFGNGNGWVGVVQLCRPFFMKLFQFSPKQQMDMNHVL